MHSTATKNDGGEVPVPLFAGLHRANGSPEASRIAMRVLWTCNILMPDLTAALGLPEAVSGSWLVALAESAEDLLSGTFNSAS